MKSGNAQNESGQWGESMDRRAHEQTYGKFLRLLKWGIVAVAVALILVAWALKG